MNDYWDNADGTMRYIADCSSIEAAVECLDKGATAAYIQGGTNDRLVQEGKFDEIAAFVDRMKKEKALFGLGAHRLETVMACVEKGFEPDFWMKTIHHGRYWSRMADKPERDNVYCREPEETIEFMNSLPQPWIGFKVLAAGALQPHDGFRYAFESGADFICVGMYDFQVVDDVNICMDILESNITRKRPWCFT
jgi:putative N-acetylmannosamine-6-phosphate epimerase